MMQKFVLVCSESKTNYTRTCISNLFNIFPQDKNIFIGDTKYISRSEHFQTFFLCLMIGNILKYSF